MGYYYWEGWDGMGWQGMSKTREYWVSIWVWLVGQLSKHCFRRISCLHFRTLDGGNDRFPAELWLVEMQNYRP